MLWRKVIGYWKSILVIGVIAYLSLLRQMPNVGLPSIVGIDKWIHGTMYLLLAVALLWDSRSVQGWKRYLIVAVVAAIYGGFIEVLQEQFFYPRTGDWVDWMADCVGVGVGLVMWIIGEKWYEQRVAK